MSRWHYTRQGAAVYRWIRDRNEHAHYDAGAHVIALKVGDFDALTYYLRRQAPTGLSLQLGRRFTLFGVLILRGEIETDGQ